MRIAICDDDTRFLNEVERLMINIFKEIGFTDYTIDKFTNSIDLLEAHLILCYSYLFTDVEMPDINGFRLIEKMRETNADLQTVILSSHNKYMEETFDYRAVRFIDKAPQEKLITGLRKAIDFIIEHYKNDSKTFLFHKGKELFRLRLSDVLYIGTENKQVIIFCKNDKQYHTSMTISELKEELKIHHFILANQSELVNCANFHRVYPDTIIMKNKKQITISRRMRSKIKDTFEHYAEHLPIQ